MANFFAHNEMLVHIPLCTQKEPKNILIITDNQNDLKQECARHNTLNTTFFATSTLVSTLQSAADDAFDTVIIDAAIPADDATAQALERITTHEGIVVCTPERAFKDIQTTRTLFDTMGKFFKIVMPFSYDNDEFGTTQHTAILASKFYHPTADIILQRADLIDGLLYYNSDIHPASFAQPNYVRSALKGVARN